MCVGNSNKFKLSCVLTHLKPSLYCITRHNGDDTSKDLHMQTYAHTHLCVRQLAQKPK